jgi:hypothetical protein
MKKLIFWASIISGVLAAYSMFKRGESLGTIARETTANPIGALASEIRNAV